MTSAVTVAVCRTCRPEGETGDDADRPGAVLGRAVARAVASRACGDVVEVKVIACLSACSRACSATIASEGKFAYVVGGLAPEDADDLVAFALAHAESADGVPAWRARPEKIRRNTIARVPPPGAAHALVEQTAEAAEP